jgi:hypothetical protein
MRRLPSIAVIAIALPVAGCDVLNQLQLGGIPGEVVKAVAPKVSFLGATLVKVPSERMIEAFFCPQIVPAPFGISGGSRAICEAFFGPPPSDADRQVAFDLGFRVANPNKFPLPLAEILTGVTVFPEKTNQRLGAVCLKLCPEGQACSGAPDPSSCQDSSHDIRTMGDFAQAAAGLLLSSGIALASGQAPTFTMPKVSAAAEQDVVVRFAFGPEQLYPLIRTLAEQSVEELKKGQRVSFRIPYKTEGTVWGDAGSLGRVAGAFGPASGEWLIPVDKI